MTAPLESAFGAALDTPAHAAALLRARASVAGLLLRPASEADLAAAVLTAHCWALVSGRSRLSGTMTRDEAGDLSAALARAAGHGEPPLEASTSDVSVEQVPTSLLAAVSPVVHWAAAAAGREALVRAASDLARCAHPRLSALGVLVAAGF